MATDNNVDRITASAGSDPTWRYVGIGCLGTLLALFFGCGLLTWLASSDDLIVSSQSPNGQSAIELRQVTNGFFDNNLYVLLKYPGKPDNQLTFFEGQGESRNIRILWSSDSSQFVLLTKDTEVLAAARLSTGEGLLFWSDLRAGSWVSYEHWQRDENISFPDLQHRQWMPAFVGSRPGTQPTTTQP